MDPSEVKNHFFQFLLKKFLESSSVRPSCRSFGFKRLSEDQRHELEKLFSSEDVKTAVWSCSSDKTPGHDGFSFMFIKRFSNVCIRSNGFWKQVEKMGQKLLTIRNDLNLINGSPTNEFNFQNGVRHGYPLSPFLLIIAEEALNVALIEARSKGIFEGVQASVMDDIRRNLGGTKDLMYMPKFKGVWSSIAKVRREANHLGIPLITSFQRQVGNGESISFWEDSWLGSNYLAHMFPRLFELETNKLWNTYLTTNDSDGWRWSMESSGVYSVKSLRADLDDKILPISSKIKWSSLIPKKVCVFIWRAEKDRLHARLNLDKRNIDLD
ncbi:hypothetical protein Tco_0892843 [Tanacetum coccineum]|uniref:Reverse transcriptase zinc-binding domain-containing protein n=1 Tax=Tanacetum coccineum TaxID=301880 RepID=A0ABQ5CAA4_9ASTR